MPETAITPVLDLVMPPLPVAVRVQVSDDLAAWNPANDITIGAASGSGPNGASYTVADAGTFDHIIITIPKNSARNKFASVIAVK